MSKPVHSKNEILRSNTGLTINPSKAYSRSETRYKLTGLTIFQGGLFRQSQAIKNRFPSRATGTPRLEEHMLIVFCMLLVPSVQVKHQGSDQSPRLSVSIPSRSSFKVHVKVHGFQIEVHGFSIHSVQVKHQGSDQSPRLSVSIPSRSSFKVQVKVHGFQIKFHGFRYIKTRWAVTHLFLYISSVHSIQVKLQGSSQGPPYQGKLQGSGQGQRVQVEVHGFRSSFKVQVKVHGYQVKLQGSRQGQRVQVEVHGFSIHSIQVKLQGPGQGPRFSGISKLDEQLLTCFCIFLVSIPSRSSFKVQVKVHGFRYIKTRWAVTHLFLYISSVHSIQVKLQGSGQGPRFSDQVPRFQYPFRPGQASRFRSRSTVFRSSSTVSVSIPSRSSFKVQVKVHGFQIKFHGFRYIKTRWAVTHLFLYISSVHSIQVKLQGSGQGPRFSDQGPRFSVSIPSRSSFKVQVKVHGFQIKVHGFQVKLQGSGQGPRFSGISKLDEQLLTCFCIFLVSIPSRSSFKVQVKVHRF
ncbi:hypothetical protein PHYBLDRAFT_176473, partial [Phycomyces blakesleeanus NRRL 1555(-)]